MEAFQFYFPFGWEHIISLDALDHQLFLLALLAGYGWKDWKNTLLLVTAFTVGHSLTLLLSVGDWVRVDSKWVEFLIPLTIVLAAGKNLLVKANTSIQHYQSYVLALFFGLIHGLGFANTIRMMLATDQQLGWGLLGFNCGLEVGQLIIVSVLLGLTFLIGAVMKASLSIYSFFVSSLSLGIAASICYNRFPFSF
ncbi:MAG: HupE/UreJ family protein [Bacteroidetes bacterium]|nr:HupE/UreJ family protein [Bacteroidota bacterium]